MTEPTTPLAVSALFSLGYGALAAIHPCPLTANIAALGLITGWAKGFWHGLRLGLAYALGFAAVYLVIGILVGLLSWSLGESVGGLPQVVGMLIGPVFIITGMFQAGLLKLPDPGGRGRLLKERLQRKQWNLLGALMLGVLLALAFCPGTATAFGPVLALIVEHQSVWLLPILFGLGAALPLAVLAACIAGQVTVTGQGAALRWLPRVAGTLVILVGVYLTVVNVIL